MKKAELEEMIADLTGELHEANQEIRFLQDDNTKLRKAAGLLLKKSTPPHGGDALEAEYMSSKHARGARSHAYSAGQHVIWLTHEEYHGALDLLHTPEHPEVRRSRREDS